MTKTRIFTAVAVALSGASFVAGAAQVTLYGVVDEGLMYTHSRTDGKSANKLEMKSGYNSGNRFGFRGTEELSGDLKVGFKLESGFDADTGTLKKNRLFHREAALTLSGSWGSLAAGRMGGVGSGAGTYDLVYSVGEVTDAVWMNVEGMHMTGRYDNMLTYQSPKFAGLQATLQYSFKGDSLNEKEGAEGTAKATRYYGGALTYSVGSFNSVLAYEYVNRGNNTATYKNDNQRNGQAVSLGANYDFGVMKLFGLVQYADGADSLGRLYASNLKKTYGVGEDDAFAFDGFKGWAAHLGASIPVCGGLLMTGLYYADGKAEKVKVNDADKAGSDLRFYGVNAQYNYPLSKRTTIYTGLGYGSSKLDASDDSRKYKSEETTVYAGISHRF